MMQSLNKVCLMGHLGNDPKIINTANGGKIANFSLATSESWKDKLSGEYKSKTQWHNISVSNEQIVMLVEKYIKKGSKVYLEGKLQTRTWLDNNKIEKTITEVALANAKSLLILLDKQANTQSQDSNVTSVYHNNAMSFPQKSQPSYEMLDDDIPF